MPEKFQCPSCQKEYRWKPEIAGKRAKCACGTAIQIPAADEPAPAQDFGIYDVSETPPPPPPAPSRVMPLSTATATATMPTRAAAPAIPQPLPMGAARLPWQVQGAGMRPNRDACHLCGADAPVKYVEFHQNVGALVVRFHRSVKGNLCKSCIHSKFWSMTMTTLAVGWLGYISIVLAPIFIVNNIVRYVGCLGMPSSNQQ